MPAEQNKKILIVEDEKPMAHALEMKLQHMGYDAHAVFDGQAGLDFIASENPSLILLDLVMPRVDGFGVLENLKAQGNKTPVIVLSNLSQKEDEEKATALGAKGFFIKSNIPIADIVNKVKEILG